MFGYALKRELLDRNPVEAIGKVKIVSGAVAIFTPDEPAKVLSAVCVEARSAIAIGAFAGLRTAEILRLDWREVDLERGHIEVTERKAKTAKRRLVKIAPNLAPWLEPDRKEQGKIYPLGWRSYHEDASAAARLGGLAWPQNGLRHSFASYHLALHQNAPALALEMGQTSPRMIFDHYREVVTREEAEGCRALAQFQGNRRGYGMSAGCWEVLQMGRCLDSAEVQAPEELNDYWSRPRRRSRQLVAMHFPIAP